MSGSKRAKAISHLRPEKTHADAGVKSVPRSLLESCRYLGRFSIASDGNRIASRERDEPRYEAATSRIIDLYGVAD